MATSSSKPAQPKNTQDRGSTAIQKCVIRLSISTISSLSCCKCAPSPRAIAVQCHGTNIYKGSPYYLSIKMRNRSELDTSSIYDADLSSDAATFEAAKNTPEHCIVRRKDSTCIEAGSTHSKPSDLAAQAQPQAEVHIHNPQLGTKNSKSPRRCGKADWRPDVSSALFSASGQQYGLGDHQRGYLSNTYVTYLSYPDSVTDQQSMMFTTPGPSLHNDTTDPEDHERTSSVTSVSLGSQTGITSLSLSPRCCQTSSDMVTTGRYGPNYALVTPGEENLEGFKSMIYGGIYTQNDVVGQYLARRDAQ
ncbi:uncharacterized protein M421DRAFT_396354 [Didymella exigua CBS 183.55]|uniref:Uncharacterized protein n=1 Tax=Didymella exigua CBS 183.55 TaxID=1150837 RepID=A0A6A5RHG8_9PLEO|nr:uncharacterized protein M421DRAFT_396354 [Didymella exigua CBS 183.55]KAF1926534.1 hypothetical protein M421DRAFT_396354 [Didymella exigua CBS 183.55]